MRKFCCLLLAVSLFIACNNNKKPQQEEKETKDTAVTGSIQPQTATAAVQPEKLLGSFVGPFGDNKITMLIIKAKNDSIEGRTIVGGNDRPFFGTYVEKEGRYTISAKEPGDDKYDGAFTFSMDTGNTDKVTGSWTPNDPKLLTKEYTLQRKKFEYKQDVGDFPQSSQRLLKAKDVENMMKEDLMFMRNEIFARHGYCFKKKDLRQQFEMQDWYVPNTVDIRGFLTDVEKKNIQLIKRYEKYADEYGDEYGR